MNSRSERFSKMPDARRPPGGRTRRTPRTLLAAALVSAGVALTTAHTALAQDAGESEPTETSLTDSDAARETASEHFWRGVELFQETHYRAALIEFERAYETLPDFRLHYNIAQTKRLLLDYVGAVQSYERYLSDGGAAVPEERQQEVREQLARLQERIAHLTITSNQESVRIYLNDELVGVTPITRPIAVNVGRHVVEARSSEGVESSQTVDVAGGDTRAVYLPVEAPAEVAEPEASEPTDEPAQPPRETEHLTARRYAISAMAVGGASLLAAVGAGVVAAVEQNNFEQARDDGMLGAAAKHSQRTERSALAVDILASVGLALSVSGIVTWAVKKPKKERSSARGAREVTVGLGPGNLSIEGTF